MDERIIEERFLSELEATLAGLPRAEIEAARADCAEHFRLGRAQGLTAAAVVQSLGRARTLAAAYRAERAVRGIDAPGGGLWTQGRAFGRGLVALLGLGFANLVFVVGPAVGAAAALVALWTFALVPFLVAATLTAAVSKAYGFAAVTTMVGVAWLLAALGAALAGAAFVTLLAGLTRGVLALAARYLRINAALIAGRPAPA